MVRKRDDRWGEVPVAFAARTDETLTEDEVIGMCRGRIANYKLPKEVHFVAMEELPPEHVGEDTAACAGGAVGVGGGADLVFDSLSWWAGRTE